MRRLTQREAAEQLGITFEAIKKRVKRGSLPSEMGEDGRRYVYLDASLPEDGDATRAGPGPGEATDLLYEEMRSRIADLRVQLEAERTASAELRRIVAALTQRIPAIEASGAEDAPESPERAASWSDAPTPTDAGGEHEEAVEDQRGWFRRFFGV